MLDAARFASRVAGELGRIGVGRLLPRSPRVPGALARADATWVADVLRHRFPGVAVARVHVLSEDAGTTSRRRLAIEYSGRGESSTAPDSVFVKLRPPGLLEQLFGRMFNLGPNEVAFYRDVRPSLPIRAPEAYAARVARDGSYVLVLEDLADGRSSLKTIADELSLEAATAVVDALARLHATFWGTARFPWLRTASHNPNAAVERYVCRLAHRPTLERFSDLLPPRVRSGARRIHERRPALERYWSNAPLTLIHGDSHAGNVYFAEGEAGFFDWQVTQHHQGIRDVAYFLVLSLETQLRRRSERQLVERYRRRLREMGVSRDEAHPDRLWERYRSFSLYAYMGASVTATMSDLQPESIARLGLRRAATAVDDLDALALLDQIG